MPEPTDAEREQDLRDYASFLSPESGVRVLLRLLDAERARADAAEAMVDQARSRVLDDLEFEERVNEAKGGSDERSGAVATSLRSVLQVLED